MRVLKHKLKRHISSGIGKVVHELRHDDSKGSSSISPALTQLKSSKLEILTSEDRNAWRFLDPMFKAYVREHKEELLLKKIGN